MTDEQCTRLLKTMFNLYKSYNLAHEYAVYDKLPRIYVWLLGLNKIQGLGRDMKSKHINALKKLLMDCTAVNLRFLVFTTTMQDMSDLLPGMRWFICEELSTQSISRIKAAEDYPDQVGGGLAVLFEPTLAENKCCKFKKMFLDGELPPVG